MVELPSGTVTFVFTDLEDSTRLWEAHPRAMQPALARHDEILRDVVTAHAGSIVKTTGDGIHAAFPTAHDALDAAVAMQLALVGEEFGETGPLRVRIGVHTCEAEYRDGDYYGSGVNRAARLMNVAHGGQIVVSTATSELVRDGSFGLVDLGEHHLRDLTSTERVFQLTHTQLRAEFPPLRSLDALPGNLPRQVTTFVGREREIASLAELVRDSSLVTLTGVGGVGKTRLALQVAAEVVGGFPDGAWLCEFAAVTDPGAVWETLAACLRVQPSAGRGFDESVLDYLTVKRLLLVLDNCEHLLDALARQVDAIARRCPRVSVLATSREGLALAGERIVAVPSLGVPAADADADELLAADAVRLFSDRACAAKVDFALTDHNIGAVAVLCRRLDGIPLAIELAAARVRSMTAEDLVSRLDQRFKLLTRGSRAALERHQTLRSTIDWSYDLLDPTERRALNRLSVFAGGCDLAAAEAVLAGDDLEALDVVDVLSQLVDKSLVVVDASGDSVRYRLLETIRQYGQEKLQESGETSAARRRHADHYVALAEAAGPHLRSRDHVVWADVVARDSDNFRAALDWAVEEPAPQHALRMVAPLAVQGPTGEMAMEWASTAIAIPGGAGDPLFPIVAAWAAWAAIFGGKLERAEELTALAERAQAAFAAPHPALARARATLAFFRGDLEQARRHADEWVELARAAGDSYELANALTMLGGTLEFAELIDDALATVDEAVRVARGAGIDNALSWALLFVQGLLPLEESERALALLDEAIELGTRIGERMGAASGMAAKGWIAARRGEWRAALGTSADAAEQMLQVGNLATLGGPFAAAGVSQCGSGHLDSAAVLIGFADAMSPRVGAAWVLEMVAATDATLLEALGERQVATLAAQGAALELVDAVAYLRAEADRALHEE